MKVRQATHPPTAPGHYWFKYEPGDKWEEIVHIVEEDGVLCMDTEVGLEPIGDDNMGIWSEAIDMPDSEEEG